MKYQALVDALVNHLSLDEDDIREVLKAFPEVLMDHLEVGDKVQTPIGTFTKKVREPRRIKDVNTGEWVETARREYVDLKVTSKLTRDL